MSEGIQISTDSAVRCPHGNDFVWECSRCYSILASEKTRVVEAHASLHWDIEAILNEYQPGSEADLAREIRERLRRG